VRVVIYTIVNELSWAKFSIENALKYAGMKCEVITTGWRIPKETKQWVEEQGFPCYEFPDKGNFLTNLYTGWRMGFEKAPDGSIVVPFGTDQAFYKNWLINLVKYVKKDRIIFCNLIEAGVLPSRHTCINFGLTPEEFREEEFFIYCSSIYEDRLKTPEEAGLLVHHPVKGTIYRPDCKPMALYRELYIELGGEPREIINGVTGDVYFIDKAVDNGIKLYQSAGSISYHFQAGRKRFK